MNSPYRSAPWSSASSRSAACTSRIGSSAQLIEKIVDAHQALGLDRFLGQIDWGGLPRAAVTDSVHRYAEEIGPAVRAAIATHPPGPATA